MSKQQLVVTHYLQNNSRPSNQFHHVVRQQKNVRDKKTPFFQDGHALYSTFFTEGCNENVVMIDK